MGRPKAGVVKTGKSDVEVVRVDPDALQNEGLFDSASLDVNANVPLLDLLSAMNADSADGTVTVSKITIKPGGARVEEWLFSGQPSGDLLNDLQADYGPGTYSIKVYSRDADGVKAIRANKSITIGALPASKVKAAEVEAAPAVDRFTEFLAQQATIAAQREAHMFQLIQAIATKPAGDGNQLSGFKTFAESVGLLQKNSPAAPGPLDMLGALESMLKMVKGLTAPAADALPRGEDGDIGPNALLAQGMQMFAQILALAKGAQPTPPQAALAAPMGEVRRESPQNPAEVIARAAQLNPAPVPGNGAAPEPTPEEEEAMLMQIFMQRLIRAARKNEPVEGYAEQVEPLLTDDAIAAIRTPEWFAALCTISEDCAPHQAWFARLRDVLLKLLDDDPDAPVILHGNSPGEPGSAPH